MTRPTRDEPFGQAKLRSFPGSAWERTVFEAPPLFVSLYFDSPKVLRPRSTSLPPIDNRLQ